MHDGEHIEEVILTREKKKRSEGEMQHQSLQPDARKQIQRKLIFESQVLRTFWQEKAFN